MKFLLILLLVLSFSTAFVSLPARAFVSRSTLQMTLLNYKGKKVDFKPGTPMRNACAKLGIRPTYSCNKGNCATCTISVGGYEVKACVGKVPPEPTQKSLRENGIEVRA